MKTKNKSKNKWFIKVRGSYLPASSQGWLTYIPFVTYLVLTLLYTHHFCSNMVGVIYLVLVQWLAAFCVMTLIAKQKS